MAKGPSPSNASDDHTIIHHGRPLPHAIAEVLANTGTGGCIVLPEQMVISSLFDLRPSDIDAFQGPARFRVGLCRNFLLISIIFGGKLSFDIVWSPVIARRTGEPPMEKPGPGMHPLFNFILADAHQIVRSLRTATISHECGMALWRARNDLMSRPITAEDIDIEMQDVFARFPRDIPDH